MEKNKKKEDGPGFIHSVVGGLVCTLFLVVVVPVICSMYIQPEVTKLVGDNAFMWLSSSLIVAIIMLVVMLLFSLLLGGGAILRRYGLIGVIALIAAYWLIGNPKGAIIPVVILIVMYILGLKKGKR